MPRASADGLVLINLQSIESLVELAGPQLLHGLLQQQARLTGASAGAAIECNADGSLGVLSYWPSLPTGAGTPAWLASAAERIVAEAAYSAAHAVTPTGAALAVSADYVITHPLKSEAGRHLIIALHLRQPDADELSLARERLAWSTLAFLAAEHRQQAISESLGRLRLTGAMDVLVAVYEHDRFKAMAIAFCNQLAGALNAQRVAVGIARRGRVKLTGISHSDDVARNTGMAQGIERLMEEAVDQSAVVVYPAPEGAMQICRAAEEFVAAHGPRSVCTAPVAYDGESDLCIVVERAAGEHFDASDVDLIQLAGELCVARLVEASHRDRWFGARAAGATRRTLSSVLGPENTWIKFFVVMALTALVYICVATGPDNVEASFIVQPQLKRVIASPFDGIIAASEIREGDLVEAGATVLAALDDSELRLERVAAIAERSALLKQAEQDRASGDPTEATLATLRAKALENRVALLDARIARSTIVSPVDGVVLTGDLTRQIGAPVKEGQTLFELAPQGRLIAELRVDDSDIWRVQVGQTGELANVSHADRKVPFLVERIYPMADVMDGRNVFRVEVRLGDEQTPATADWLEPGVVGQARVLTGEARYINLWTRDIINWVRMKLWL